jgi:AraC-like DNA-binding protein
MIIRTHIPRPPLSDFVEMFWLYEGFTQPVKERALPTGTVELVISLRDDRLQVFDRRNTGCNFYGAMICGPHSEFFVIDSAKDDSVLGVHFKPGGAFPFLNLPAGELHNAHVSLENLWGAKAVELREQLLEAKTPEAKFRILERALLARASRCLTRHPYGRSPAVAFALNEFERPPLLRKISDVTDQIGLSQRHFIQVFRDEVGLTPKLFCRIQRFQEVLRRLGNGQHAEWVDLALACGYYDQAHFINDFQAFSGINPTAYLIHRGDRNPNHLPLAV